MVGINRFVDHATGDGFSYPGHDRRPCAAGVTHVILVRSSFLNTRAMAYYIDGTYAVTDKLFLTGGVRYNSETKRMNSFLYSGFDLFRSTQQACVSCKAAT